MFEGSSLRILKSQIQRGIDGQSASEPRAKQMKSQRDDCFII